MELFISKLAYIKEISGRLVFDAIEVPANVETVHRAGHLGELLVALGSVIGHSSSHVHVAVACQVVWKLAASAGEPAYGVGDGECITC